MLVSLVAQVNPQLLQVYSSLIWPKLSPQPPVVIRIQWRSDDGGTCCRSPIGLFQISLVPCRSTLTVAGVFFDTAHWTSGSGMSS